MESLKLLHKLHVSCLNRLGVVIPMSSAILCSPSIWLSIPYPSIVCNYIIAVSYFCSWHHCAPHKVHTWTMYSVCEVSATRSRWSFSAAVKLLSLIAWHQSSASVEAALMLSTRPSLNLLTDALSYVDTMQPCNLVKEEITSWDFQGQVSSKVRSVLYL